MDDMYESGEIVAVGSVEPRQARPGQALYTMSGRGMELCDMLRKELCVPEGAISFEVRFAYDELVTVRCEYTPRVQKKDAA